MKQPAAHIPALQISPLPQEAPFAGYTQAPVLLQSVAPHAPVVQAAAQQCVPVPVPPAPHSALVHWSLAEQLAPGPPFATHVPLEQ